MSLYSRRGVSAQKEEVHKATAKLDHGIFPNSFCKIYPDYIGGDDDFVNVMHADGAGTKSILAYLYWKETGDISVWRGIAQDAIVMNLDDLICAGVYDNIIFNSTIDRNKHLITAEVLQEIIDGSQEFFAMLKSFGINIHYLGGETADVGDVVRTVAVNGTMAARWRKDKIVTNTRIQAGDVIVGLASFGQSSYESEYNSGIGSNGLTSARHDILSDHYQKNFPESFDNDLPDDVSYIGRHRLSDEVFVDGKIMHVGKLLLAPTRTFAPLLTQFLIHDFEKIHGLIHCTGGGQSKCLKYVPENLKIIKDNLFTPPVIFDLISQSSGADEKEMYQVFNMGCRMEIYTAPENAEYFIAKAASLNIDARVIGRVESSDRRSLEIKLPSTSLYF
jgi:phosphoribosylformylglycinamidine cyclo-ligase